MEKIVISDNDDNSVNNNDNDNDNNRDGGQNHGDNNDGEKTKDKMSVKSDDIMHLNSQTSLKSTTNEISSLASPSTSVKQNDWKSTNPFVNYMQDCRKRGFPEQPNHKNFFQFVGTQWRLMSAKQKQSYVNGAAMIKKRKLIKIQTVSAGQKRKRLRGVMSMKKSNFISRKTKKKKLIKPKRREKQKVKRQRLIKSGSESGSASDNSHESSDNESIISDEIM